MESFNETEYNGIKHIAKIYYPVIQETINGNGWPILGHDMAFVDLAIRIIWEKTYMGMSWDIILSPEMYQMFADQGYEPYDYIGARELLRMASEEFPND